MAMLAGADEALSDVAFQYGRNVGLAFQLVDDLLDFVSSSAAMGKPTAADLKLGLATAPVLFACERVRNLTSRSHSFPDIYGYNKPAASPNFFTQKQYSNTVESALYT
jgi:geranylgeranyl pyrophosphate synthase